MSTKWESLTEEFRAAVISSFDFLIAEYDYTPLKEVDESPDIGARSIVYASYGSCKYGMVVELLIDFENFFICVILCDSPKGNIEQLPTGGRKRWKQVIQLGSLIEYRTGDENIAYPVLPHVSTLSGRENMRRRKIRIDKTYNDITAVVHEQAELLKQFGSNVLKGDKSEFPAVEEFFLQKNDMISIDGGIWYRP
ncbi:MAG: hypothetical protein JKY95_10325 [Planctomycetaceae bacterium]|nr:hypothetical protein [Planctomycetaceae bacterium]